MNQNNAANNYNDLLKKFSGDVEQIKVFNEFSAASSKHVNLPLINMLQMLSLNDEFSAAVQHEAQSRIYSLMGAVEKYQKFDYQPYQAEHDIVWQSGSVQLFAYSSPSNMQANPNQQKAILFVPSLINRNNILDISQKRSMVKFFVEQGYAVYMVDWGEPTDTEVSYDIADYVTEPLRKMIEFISQNGGHQKLVLAGHCLGGLMAMAAAQIYPQDVDGVAMLATPWDFSDAYAPFVKPNESLIPIVKKHIEQHEFFPADYLLAMFYFKDPLGYQNKLQRLANMNENSEEFAEFVAIERWVNDTYPLAQNVAKNILCDFGIENITAENKWQVAGEVISPNSLMQPCFVAMGDKDKIVSTNSAKPIVNMLKNTEYVEINSGHISMIAGKNAARELWQPMADWLGEVV